METLVWRLSPINCVFCVLYSWWATQLCAAQPRWDWLWSHGRCVYCRHKNGHLLFPHHLHVVHFNTVVFANVSNNRQTLVAETHEQFSVFYNVKKLQESLLCAARSGESVGFGGGMNKIQSVKELKATWKQRWEPALSVHAKICLHHSPNISTLTVLSGGENTKWRWLRAWERQSCWFALYGSHGVFKSHLLVEIGHCCYCVQLSASFQTRK